MKISTNRISSQIVGIVNIASCDSEYISCKVKVTFIYFDKEGFYVGYSLVGVCESMTDGVKMT